MVKSKTTPEVVDAQGVAALKLDIEHVNARTEEIDSKVEGVQQQMATLSERMSRLEALLLADRNPPPDPNKTALKQLADTGQASKQQQPQEGSYWQEGPPHWRKRSNTEPPRYEYQFQNTGEEEPAPQEQQNGEEQEKAEATERFRQQQLEPEHALANSEAPPSSAARPLHFGNNTSAPLSSSPVSSAFVPVHTSTTSTTVSAPAMSASTVPSAPAYATQLFGEMPTPKSCPRTYASALHYYQEHVTPVQSTFVPDRNNNLTEQHLDAMSEQYGFHNLNRHSVFLADGSKHSYFALLETYPLERAVPEPVFDVYDDETKGCTDEFVDEFASTPEQQLYEDPQVNVLVIHERRKEWDPGVSKLKDTILDKGAVQVQFVQQSTELSLFSLEFSISSPKRVQWDPGVKISLYKWFNILTVWTAADKQLSCTHIPDLAAWQNQSVGGAASYIWDPGTLLWYKFIWWLFTVRTNFEHNSYSTPKH